MYVYVHTLHYITWYDMTLHCVWTRRKKIENFDTCSHIITIKALAAGGRSLETKRSSHFFVQRGESSTRPNELIFLTLSSDVNLAAGNLKSSSQLLNSQRWKLSGCPTKWELKFLSLAAFFQPFFILFSQMSWPSWTNLGASVPLLASASAFISCANCTERGSWVPPGPKPKSVTSNHRWRHQFSSGTQTHKSCGGRTNKHR
jgi:hypothetical protein